MTAETPGPGNHTSVYSICTSWPQ